MYQCAGGLGCKIMILRRNKWATFNALMSSSLIFMTWWTILIESSFSSYSIQLFYPHGFPDNLSEANFDFFFNVLLTVHLCIILSIKPIWCTIFLSMFIYFLYMFRATVCPPPGETTVFIFMRPLVVVILYGCLSGMQVCYAPCIPDSQSYRIISTKCRKNSYFSWWWAHSRPECVEKRNKHTKKIAHQVGFIYKINKSDFCITSQS